MYRPSTLTERISAEHGELQKNRRFSVRLQNRSSMLIENRFEFHSLKIVGVGDHSSNVR